MSASVSLYRLAGFMGKILRLRLKLLKAPNLQLDLTWKVSSETSPQVSERPWAFSCAVRLSKAAGDCVGREREQPSPGGAAAKGSRATRKPFSSYGGFMRVAAAITLRDKWTRRPKRTDIDVKVQPAFPTVFFKHNQESALEVKVTDSKVFLGAALVLGYSTLAVALLS